MSNLVSPGAWVTVSYTDAGAPSSSGGSKTIAEKIQNQPPYVPKERSLTRYQLRRLIADRKATGNELTYDITDFSDILGLADAETKAQFNMEINWDTSKAVNMQNMFKGGETFNNGGAALNLNTDNVIDMSGMFFGNFAFDQPLQFTSTIQVNDFSEMFYNCKAFNQDVSEIETSMNAMLKTKNSAYGANGDWAAEEHFWQIPLLVENEILIHDAILI